MNNNLFEQKINDRIVEQAVRRSSEFAPGYGIVLKYDATNNTAVVLMSRPDSDEQHEVLNDVLCPVQLGVQSVAPEFGRPCWVNFKGGRKNFPVITHYFNRRYAAIDGDSHRRATTGIPQYLLSL